MVAWLRISLPILLTLPMIPGSTRRFVMISVELNREILVVRRSMCWVEWLLDSNVVVAGRGGKVVELCMTATLGSMNRV
jgi:hypothetical protein